MLAIKRLLNVDEQDNTKFYLLFFAYFFFSVGLVWAASGIRAEIVSANLYAQSQQIAAVTVIVFSVLYTAQVDKLGKDQMFIIISIGGILGIVGGAALLLFGNPVFERVALVMLWTMYMLMFYLWIIHWGTFIIEVYDARTAKKVYPLLGVGRPLATILAGFSYSVLTGAITLGDSNITEVLLGWLLTLILSTVLLGVVALRQKRSAAADMAPKRVVAAQSGISSLIEGIQYLYKSSFVGWMAFSALLVIAINTLTEEQTNQIISAYVNNDKAAFANFTAFWDGVSNIVAVFLQLFVFTRVMESAGMRNMILSYPLLSLLINGGLIFMPQVALAVLAQVNINALRRVFRDPVVGLMGNAVTGRAKGRARAVINGLVSPAGTMIAASLLLLPLNDEAWFLPTLLGAATVLYFLSAVILQREYARAMVKVLEDGSFQYLLSQDRDLDTLRMGLADRAELDRLRRQIDESELDEFKIFLVRLMVESAGKEALPLVQDLYTTYPHLQPQILEMYVRHGNLNAASRRLFFDLLQDARPAIRQLALQGMDATYPPTNKRRLKLAEVLLEDAAPEVRAQAVQMLQSVRVRHYRELALAARAELLSSSEPTQIIYGLRALVKEGNPHAMLTVLPYLESTQERIRYEATQALNALWQDPLPPQIYESLSAYIPLFVEDPVERIRLAELTLLGRFKQQDTTDTLIRILSDPSEKVRDAAVNALVEANRAVTPALEAALQSENALQAEYAAIALSRINPQRYKSTLEVYIHRKLDEIYRIYERLYALQPYAKLASVGILQDALHEQKNTRIDALFHLLENLRDETSAQSLAVIREALASRNANQRASAQETLEALSSPQITRRIAPLFDPQQSIGKVILSSEDDTQTPLNTFDVLYEFALDEGNALSNVMLYALGEIGRNHPDLASLMSPKETQTMQAVRAESEPKPFISNDTDARQIDVRRLVLAVRAALSSPRSSTRVSAKAALRILRGEPLIAPYRKRDEDENMLSTVERMIVLKRLPMFNNIVIDHLQVVASVCEERLYSKDAVLFRKGDPSNELFIVVDGEVGIGMFQEQSGAFTELARYGASSSFGETTLFKDSLRTASALALTDVVALTLRSEVLIGLLREYPDIAIAILRTFSEHLSSANARIAELRGL